MWETCAIENNAATGSNYFKTKVFGLKFLKNEKTAVYAKLVTSHNYNIHVKKSDFLWVFNKLPSFLTLRFSKGSIKQKIWRYKTFKHHILLMRAIFRCYLRQVNKKHYVMFSYFNTSRLVRFDFIWSHVFCKVFNLSLLKASHF